MIWLKLQPRWLDSNKPVSGKPGAVQVDVSNVQVDLAKENVPAGTFVHADLESVTFRAA